MNIKTVTAQNIVTSMKRIINKEINYINIDGIILASTDKKRIGDHHEGALEVIDSKKNMVIEKDDQYKGTKKGINLPIFHDAELVGVIGITGNPMELKKYVEIIKQMTEILIKDSWLKDLSLQKRENYRVFIEQLINNPANKDDIYYLANILKIDMTRPRIAVVGKFENSSTVTDNQMSILTNIFHVILSANKDDIYSISRTEARLIIDASYSGDAVQQLLINLINSTQTRLGIKLYLGVSTISNDISDFHTKYKEASTALKWSTINSDNQIEYYSDLNLGMLLTNLPRDISQEYSNKIIGNLKDNELKEYYKILSIYSRNNGSIYKTADELFIHKNTLQYKLNKLKKTTGYDPRDLEDYVNLSLALKLWSFL